VQDLLTRFQNGDERALARAITLVESGHPRSDELLAALRGLNRSAVVIGMTGAPGAGKSTLTDQLIAVCRARNERVAVLAIDPSSPFSGGAILGDRIRMGRHYQDRGVFVRSMATRGALGGLAKATVGVLSILEAFGFDRVILETVGVGQSEIDIARVADHTVLVLTPAGGDSVQAFKAGIMEIADVFAINKADIPGADRLVREIQAALEFNPHDEHSWWAKIVQTIASTGQGLSELLEAIDAHRVHLGEAGLQTRRLERARFEIINAINDEVRAIMKQSERELLMRVQSGTSTANQVARELIVAALEKSSSFSTTRVHKIDEY
jgi:LAO/AO transport system kinase